MSTPDRVGSSLRKAEVLHLPSLNEIAHCSGYILDRHHWIDSMLVQKIDHVGIEAL